MYWFYLMLVNVLSVSCNVPNLTMVIDYRLREISCLLSDDNLDTGIAWNLPPGQTVPPSRYITHFQYNTAINNIFPKYVSDMDTIACDMNEEDTCLQKWISTGDWQLGNSLYHEEKYIILDHRWEKFETIKVIKEHVLDTKNFSIPFTLSFSVQTTTDIILRVCIKNGSCILYTIIAKDKGNWVHYTMSSSSQGFYISDLEDVPFYIFPHQVTVTNLTIIVSNQSVALLKYHLNSFIFTKKTTDVSLHGSYCMAFYLKMCKGCEVLLKTIDLNNTVIESKTIYQDNDWYYVRFNTGRSYDFVSNHFRIIFRGTSPGSDPYFALDDVNLCSWRDERVSALTFSRENLHLYSCYSIKYPEYRIEASATTHIIPHSDSRCQLNSFGMRCTLCIPSNLGKRFPCNGYKVCDLDVDNKIKCSCTSGYEGPTCEQPCIGSYGFGCKEKCGECPATCEPYDGYCPKCKDGYSGDTCKTSIWPILKHPPKIQVSYTHMSFQLKSDEYNGSIKPTKYILQYKRNNEAWQNSSEYNMTDNTWKDITNLFPDTEYAVRVPLKSLTHEFEDKYVKVEHIRTICAGVAEEDVLIQPQSNNVEIIILNSTVTCHPSNFHLHFNYQTFPFTSYTLQLSSLNPYTEYEFIIESLKTNTSFEMHFITKQAAPEKIEKLRELFIKDTSVKLSWEPPRVTNGVIKYYTVFYKHYRYLSCYNTVRSKNSTGELQTEKTTVIINDLIPYSEYIVYVRAATISDGNITQIEFETLPTALPNNDEIPQLSLKQRSTFVEVYLTEVTCDKRFGLLLYTMTLCCKEEWCTCETKSVMNSNRNFTSTNFNVHGFTSYSLLIEMQRPNEKRIEKSFSQIFRTSARAPNSVRNLTLAYKTPETLSIRWLPPLPPSGEIKHYEVSYCEGSSVRNESFLPTSCIQWAYFICVKIVLKEKCLSEFQTITVVALNEEGYRSDTEAVIKTTSAIEKPDPPTNFTATWDDQYNLTLTWIHNSVNPASLFKIKMTDEAGQDLETSEISTSSNNELLQTYRVLLTNATVSSKLLVTLSAENLVGKSNTIALVTYSPPNTPEFKANPYVAQTGNSWVLIIVPKLSLLSNDSNMYVVVSDTNEVNKTVLEKFLNDILKTTVTKDDNTLWIATELVLGTNANKERLVTLGSEDVKYSAKLKQNIFNRSLKPGIDYIATFLLSNTFHYKTRTNVRTVTFSIPKNVDAENGD